MGQFCADINSTGGSKAVGKLGGGIGFDSGYTESYRALEAQKFVDQYGSFAGYTEGAQVSNEASANHTEYTGAESGQHARSEHSASLTEQASSGTRDAADLTHTVDIRQRGSTQNVSRVDTTNNLLTPENLQAVAARNGMRYGRLMTMPAAEIQRLVSEDALMRDLVKRNSALPPTARDGSPLPSVQGDIARQNKHDRARISADVPGAFQRFATDVGPVDTTALDVKPSVPSEVGGAQARVDAVRQRVSNDADLPIRQVQDHVIPSGDNRSLMTLDRSPARPLVTKPAVGSQGTPSPTRLSEADFKILPVDPAPSDPASATSSPRVGAAVKQSKLSESDASIVPGDDVAASTPMSRSSSSASGDTGHQSLAHSDSQIAPTDQPSGADSAKRALPAGESVPGPSRLPESGISIVHADDKRSTSGPKEGGQK